jgi:putative transposase
MEDEQVIETLASHTQEKAFTYGIRLRGMIRWFENLDEHRQVYGSPRIHAMLKARGIHCSCKHVVRLMQQLGLSAQVKKRRKPTTTSNPPARFAPNRLGMEFAASWPNQKWVTNTKTVETADG